MADVVIGKASVDDAEPLTRLVCALGYPTSTGQMRQRLEAITGDASFETLVARDDGVVVGFVGTRIGRFYEFDDDGQIMTLAVALPHQRRGIGRRLLKAAESSLVERGARVLVVTTGNQRADAHAFYDRCGYACTGRRYKKTTARSAEHAAAADERREVVGDGRVQR